MPFHFELKARPKTDKIDDEDAREKRIGAANRDNVQSFLSSLATYPFSMFSNQISYSNGLCLTRFWQPNDFAWELLMCSFSLPMLATKQTILRSR